MNKLNEHELQSIFENFSECPVVIRAVEEMLSLREQLAELKAALSAANERLKGEPVPVESHRVCQVLLEDAWVDVSYGAMEHQKKHGVETRILFTAAPQPAGFTVEGE
ncbi:TPA: hypothetical protein ACPZRO_002732 [Yersinia enterocolitica]|uniref:hypothetical protein n=1 Tax=Yersinia enterocolitica TaxID=630 RepID=UPI003705FEBC